MTTDDLREQEPDAFKVFKNSDGRELTPLKNSTNQNEIDTLLYILENANGKWRIDVVGVPVGTVRVVFYKSDTRINSFSFGEELIVAQGCGYFAAAPISISDQDSLLEITGLKLEDLQ